LIYIWLTWLIYQEFGWEIYKKIGADRAIKKMYKWYQVFAVVLKFGRQSALVVNRKVEPSSYYHTDYFFFIGFSLQILFLVFHESESEKLLTEIAIPFALVLLIFGYLAAKYEWKYLMWGFLAGCVAAATYFAAKLVRIYQKRDTDYALVFRSLTVFCKSPQKLSNLVLTERLSAALSLLMLLATASIGIICLKNFGKGLRNHMLKKARTKSKMDLTGMNYETGDENFDMKLKKGGGHLPLGSLNGSRMSFD
jgi:hypothetical protein